MPVTKNISAPTAISLFSGAGGMDIGFSDAGFNVLAAVELDVSCCDTLRSNTVGTKVINQDISTLSGDALLKEVGISFGELDMLFGGPPCQSFSLAGNRRGLDDPRGQLVGHFARLVHEIGPRSFVMENVKGMTNWSKGQALQEVLEQLEKPIVIGGKQKKYRCVHHVLNSADFGVPQFRERLFIVGNRMDVDFYFPTPTHTSSVEKHPDRKPHQTVGEAIGELPPASMPSATALRVSQTIKDRIVRHGY